jgi:hypothetical protein
MKHKNLLALLLGLALLVAAYANAAAQMRGGEHNAPQSSAAPNGTKAFLTYQGRLTASSGVPINSSVNAVFKLYDSNNNLMWTSATRNITPINGLFTVYLGDGADPTLDFANLGQVASIGVTVGSDPEMSPRQPLNTVVGNSVNGVGVYAFSVNGSGVYGLSENSVGVAGFSSNSEGISGGSNSSTRGGLAGFNQTTAGPALEIRSGSIRVDNAGVDTTTPVFMHQVKFTGGAGDNVCAPFGVTKYATIIDNPLTNNNPNAILIVTPNYRKTDTSQSNVNGPAADIPEVAYSVSGGCGTINKWIIVNLKGTAMVDNTYYNVMVVVP